MPNSSSQSQDSSFLNSIISNLNGIIFRLEIEPLRRPVYLSPQVKEVFGHTPEYYYQEKKFIRLHLHEEDLSRWESSIQSTIYTKSPLNESFRMINKENLERIYQIKGRLTQKLKDGDSVYFDAIFYDITDDLNKAKKILEQEQQLESVGKFASIGEMSANVVHEISNPITTLSLQVEKLKEEFKSPTPDLVKSNERILKIHNNTQRIVKIIQMMKRISNQNSRLHFESIKLKSLIEESLFFAAENAKKKNIELTINNSTEEDLLIQGNPTELSQVIFNLINNAVDAVQEYDEKWVRIEFEVIQEYLNINVIDSGKGIPSDVANRLFEPFYTTKPVGKGTGLGLPLAQQIMKKHKGDLFLLTSHPNTCFVVRLPISKNTLQG
ncbi:MAG TPA: PAS domain-containing sensor histidine kinase [Pseudobdellovibrionaceae bacterium]|nr:PAS domain-containing sensor histidine kinase [Pseudobdellovibrionaceae bacterium]